MEKVNITGDTTRSKLESLINALIKQHGKEVRILISPNLNFVRE